MATTEENSCEPKASSSSACDEQAPMETDQEEKDENWNVIAGMRFWTDNQIQLIPYPKLKLSEGVTLDRQALFIKMHNFLNGTQPKLKLFIKVWCALILDTPAEFTDRDKLMRGLLEEEGPSIGEQTFQGKSFEVKLTARVMKLDSMSSNFSQELKFPHVSEKTKFHQVTVNDAKFHEWYMNPENLNKARKYFGYLCINMLRILARNESNARVHLIARFYERFYQFADSFLSFGPNVCEKFVDKAKVEFKRKHKIYRGILRLLIDFFHQKGCITYFQRRYSQGCIEAFCDYAIRKPFEGSGLQIIGLVQGGHFKLNDSDWKWFHEMMFAHENMILREQYLKYRYVLSYSNLINRQHEQFLVEYPNFKGKTINLFAFSRVLDGKYFSLCANDKLKELSAFVCGLTYLPLERTKKIFALKQFPELEEYYILGKSTRDTKDKAMMEDLNASILKFCNGYI